MFKMGPYSGLASLLLFITTAFGLPATDSGIFQVLQQANLNFTKNAAAIHFSDLAKYNVTHNSTYAATIEAVKQSGGTPAIPLLWESEYVCPVVIGGQTVYLDFDTGSSDLWVLSTLTNVEGVGHKVYDPKLSTSSKLLPGATWDITYADGSGSGGIVFKDRVAIGSSVAVDQAVEVPLVVSPQFAANPFNSGLLGLAFSTINTVSPIHQLTYFENILPTLKEPLFTADLRHGRPGTYNFGFIDPAAFKGPIAWTPVTKPQGYYAYWQLDVTGFQVGPEPYHEHIISGIAGESNLLYLPPGIVLEYYSKVVGAFFDSSNAAWVFPCTSHLPDFIFGIGAYRGVVPGNYILFQPLGDDLCYGGIQVDTGLPFSIFGDILLKAQFVIFDHSGPRLGFANKL
ncbi:aspartic peptidase domain-containing protein [Aspergillus pseudonomiae]|uniref:Aspergillopepsin-1 n=1 Tax=Aspergillus pseudonomiae TaxID=1506151 RepID=A0A5N7D813_9EURO|nr:aspartic peptidase domain-containing protein [Aspergillus pseudonomiae]KAB8265343.1 aspartic peptidase domain-containing protein [Aspergillus pseudonomiae]KAE8402454.1 aspartic peptidase domain-containing protein [Aspergillus pseudonomiae]